MSHDEAGRNDWQAELAGLRAGLLAALRRLNMRLER